MIPEILLLRFGFYCINESERGRIKEIILQKEEIKREIIREEVVRLLPNVVKGLEETANGRDPWGMEVTLEYCLIYHNQMIDEGKGSFKHHRGTQAELCKSHLAKIIRRIEGFYEVTYESKKTLVSSEILGDIDKDKKVYIHKGLAFIDHESISLWK